MIEKINQKNDEQKSVVSYYGGKVTGMLVHGFTAGYKIMKYGWKSSAIQIA